MNKRALGKKYEEKACQYLESQGMKIVEKNFRCRQGEIDLIGFHGEYLAFVEVKYRAGIHRPGKSKGKYVGRRIITVTAME